MTRNPEIEKSLSGFQQKNFNYTVVMPNKFQMYNDVILGKVPKNNEKRRSDITLHPNYGQCMLFSLPFKNEFGIHFAY